MSEIKYINMKNSRRDSTILFLAVAIPLLSLSLVQSVLESSATFSNRVEIKTVNLELLTSSGDPLTLLDWGTLEPNETKVQQIQVKSLSNVDMTLTLTFGNFNPTEASSYVDVTWNKENTILIAGGTVLAEITLHIHSDISEIPAFTFGITITGSG